MCISVGSVCFFCLAQIPALSPWVVLLLLPHPFSSFQGVKKFYQHPQAKGSCRLRLLFHKGNRRDGIKWSFSKGCCSLLHPAPQGDSVRVFCFFTHFSKEKPARKCEPLVSVVSGAPSYILTLVYTLSLGIH